MTAHRPTYTRPSMGQATGYRLRWHWNRVAVVLFVVTFALVLAAMVTLAALASATDGDLLPSQGGTLSPCATEDAAGPCYWDASARGNGEGRSFTVSQDGTLTYWDEVGR